MSDAAPLMTSGAGNVPASYWMCWTCVQPVMVLGGIVDQRCARCGEVMEYMSGLLVADDGPET